MNKEQVIWVLDVIYRTVNDAHMSGKWTSPEAVLALAKRYNTAVDYALQNNWAAENSFSEKINLEEPIDIEALGIAAMMLKAVVEKLY